MSPIVSKSIFIRQSGTKSQFHKIWNRLFSWYQEVVTESGNQLEIGLTK